MQQLDLRQTIHKFTKKTEPTDRYRSFDYCYNYFRQTMDLTADMEKSCLVLGFYLASWGMFRGSSFILQHSAKNFEKTIEYISKADRDLWHIDVDQYDDASIQKIIVSYNKIKAALVPDRKSDRTLVTKIMLGVFGCIPAYDYYFCNTFRKIADGQCGFRSVNETSLKLLKEFYDANKAEIDQFSQQITTTDFTTGQETHIHYPKAKIIDMYGFTKGLAQAKKDKELKMIN